MNAEQRLKEVRNIFHMNQTEFAKRTGITGSLISQIERGAARLTWKTAHAIENELGINADWLMTGEGEIVSDRRKETEGLGVVPAVGPVSGRGGIGTCLCIPDDAFGLGGAERNLRAGAGEAGLQGGYCPVGETRGLKSLPILEIYMIVVRAEGC